MPVEVRYLLVVRNVTPLMNRREVPHVVVLPVVVLMVNVVLNSLWALLAAEETEVRSLVVPSEDRSVVWH